MIHPTGPTIDRTTYLGASEIAAVVGLSPYATALDVQASKKGWGHRKTTRPMEIGNVMERPTLELLYAPRVGTQLRYPGTLQNDPSRQWFAATPDAIAVQRDRCVECKIVGEHSWPRWGREDEGADGIPPEVLCQVHWQAHALRCMQPGLAATTVDVYALHGTEDRLYEVEIDDGFLCDLLEAGARFWRDHIEGDALVRVTRTGDTVRGILQSRHPYREGARQIEPDELDKARRYNELRATESAAKAEKELLGLQLRDALAGASCARNDAVRVTSTETRGRVDWKAVAMAAGASNETIEKHRGSNGRTLKVTVKGDDE